MQFLGRSGDLRLEGGCLWHMQAGSGGGAFIAQGHPGRSVGHSFMLLFTRSTYHSNNKPQQEPPFLDYHTPRALHTSSALVTKPCE